MLNTTTSINIKYRVNPYSFYNSYLELRTM